VLSGLSPFSAKIQEKMPRNLKIPRRRAFNVRFTGLSRSLSSQNAAKITGNEREASTKLQGKIKPMADRRSARSPMTGAATDPPDAEVTAARIDHRSGRSPDRDHVVDRQIGFDLFCADPSSYVKTGLGECFG